MHLSLARRTEYGIAILMELAARPGEVTTAAELARSCGILAGNIPAIVSTLSRAGIVTSSRGRAGGCALARPASEVTILEIVQALEGPAGLTRCLLDSRRCPEEGMHCAVHAAWIAGRDAALGALADTSLEKATRRHQRETIAHPRNTR